MDHVAKRIRRFLVPDDGATAVEYGVMLALIIVACSVAITFFGKNTMMSFTNTANSITPVNQPVVLEP